MTDIFNRKPSSELSSITDNGPASEPSPMPLRSPAPPPVSPSLADSPSRGGNNTQPVEPSPAPLPEPMRRLGEIPRGELSASLTELPTAQQALAFVQWLGLTARELEAATRAPDISPEQLRDAAKVNVSAIARAFPREVTSALAASNCPIGLRGVTGAELAQKAENVALAEAFSSKLRALAHRVDAAARYDASTLDEVTRTIVRQVEARADIDPMLPKLFHPVTAYHRSRYPGSRGPRSVEVEVEPVEPPAK